jgi:beta-galactosidase GanA
MFSEAFGVDYYPEQWPEERWSEDARLMAEAGFNVVRLAEFAWSSMEPSERRYDFTGSTAPSRSWRRAACASSSAPRRPPRHPGS